MSTGARVGKTVYGLCASEAVLFVLVQEHGSLRGAAGAETVPDLMTRLVGMGVDEAVLADGSDSVALLADGLTLVTPGGYKDNSIPVGPTLELHGLRLSATSRLVLAATTDDPQFAASLELTGLKASLRLTASRRHARARGPRRPQHRHPGTGPDGARAGLARVVDDRRCAAPALGTVPVPRGEPPSRARPGAGAGDRRPADGRCTSPRPAATWTSTPSGISRTCRDGADEGGGLPMTEQTTLFVDVAGLLDGVLAGLFGVAAQIHHPFSWIG